ncbi:serine/threonine-protein kinase ZRK3-like [Cannabis sativa]|uniref:serine/threonine-protein kinase ZRK3-like n=1 Tax=Cannabis sativa TaxID=3483 RepID=UPI0029C9E214|nr:serine/threonine-protein kinase ZRK3-like [Cannabis sativa]
MFSCYKKNNTKVEEDINGFFLRNGGAVLEQTIRLFNGKSNPLRSYSSQQLNNATNNYHVSRIIHQGGGYNMYRGVIDRDDEDCEISVKVYTNHNVSVDFEMIANDVAIASQMSNHKNVLKLLGYCLDRELPILVYELPLQGNLSRFLLYRNENCEKEEPPPPSPPLLLPFETKLRIGIGIANALAYLHHGHSKTFIYRDIRKEVVLLDQDYGAKLFDFQASLPIPEGKTHVDVDRVIGTYWYMSPEVRAYGRYTERSDVYGFGVLFSELLSGKSWGYMADPDSATVNSPYLGASFDNWFDAWKNELKINTLREEGEEEIRGQIMECVKLVEKCTKENVGERPDMVESEQQEQKYNRKRWFVYEEWSLNCTLHKGSVIVSDDDEEEISVKMFFPKFNNERHLKMIANGVAVASQMSNHRNVLKLLGYCLDSELPVLVYELPFHGNLLHISELAGQAPFERKLKICIGIANAISYLHHDHSKTFINRDIRRGQVFLDKDYNAKLCRKTWGQILWDITDGSSNYDWNGKLKHELETNALVEEEEIRGPIMECAKAG